MNWLKRKGLELKDPQKIKKVKKQKKVDNKDISDTASIELNKSDNLHNFFDDLLTIKTSKIDSSQKILSKNDKNESNQTKKSKKIKDKSLKQQQDIDLKQWNDFKFCNHLMNTIKKMKYKQPTPIQSLCIPAISSGKDVQGQSVTGSGKTAAYLLPLMQRYYVQSFVRGQYVQSNYSKVLIIVPTRELAIQCYEMFMELNENIKLRASVIIGKTNQQKQEAELRSYPDFIIGTPGRILDHLQNTRSFDLDDIEVIVFDEADKLLELGFKSVIQEISKYANKDRQTLLYSATLNKDVNQIVKICMKTPIRLSPNIESIVADKLQQKILSIETENDRESALLAVLQYKPEFQENTIIFFKTKTQCHRAFHLLQLTTKLKIIEINSNLSQSARTDALQDFKDKKYQIMLATDLAGRGLDIKDLKTVINFEMPTHTNRYIHRVGRTARAGKSGISLSICTKYESKLLRKIVQKQAENVKVLKIEKKTLNKFQNSIKQVEDNLQEILDGEKLEREVQKAEVQAQKAENMLLHQEEIINRPKKKWFQSYRQKNELNKQSKEENLDEL